MRRTDRSFHHDILHSLVALKKGGVILYPTDTVWGIGCDATNGKAVERLYKIKKRKETCSMLTLVADVDMLLSYVYHIPDVALLLHEDAEKPLSIIYSDVKNLAANLIAEDGSAGIRIVKDDFCRQVIKKLKKPIVSTSANISGESTPRTFAEISENIKNAVDYIVQWRQNDNQLATASSIIKLKKDGTFDVLR